MQPPTTQQPMAEAAAHYDELDQLLQLSPLSPTAAEAQGIFLGLVSGARIAGVHAEAQSAEDRLLAELFPVAVANAETASDASPEGATDAGKIALCRALLADVAAQARGQAEGTGMAFQLLLPSEERPLRERAIAVHGWTRGFLFGLGLTGIDTTILSDPAREAFGDLLEITRMDLEDLDDDQTNEEALTEIVEFIRVAALLMLEEQTSGPPSPASGAARQDLH
jgi:uncharacterized protein YgfB (UPF0149 family)